MAIRLHIQENKVRLKVKQSGAVHLSASEGVPVYPPAYEGATEVTPSAERQILLTGGLYVTDHIKVNPIPSNYGLITWNGSTLTVS